MDGCLHILLISLLVYAKADGNDSPCQMLPQHAVGPLVTEADECYRLTTYDHKQLGVTASGGVVVKEMHNQPSALHDFVLQPLDTFYNSVIGSIANNVFIWQIVSPSLKEITGCTLNYLAANCGEYLHVKPMIYGQCVKADGHFIRQNVSQTNDFRYQVFNASSLCLLHLESTGQVLAKEYTNLPISNLYRLPVHHSLLDFTLQVEACPPQSHTDRESWSLENVLLRALDTMLHWG